MGEILALGIWGQGGAAVAALLILRVLVSGRRGSSHQKDGKQRRAAYPRHLRGRARVIDGDTVEISGWRIRLEGMDAPEVGQKGKSFFARDMGEESKRAAARLAEGRRCEAYVYGKDLYGRLVARVIVHRLIGSFDLGEELLRDGMAIFCPYQTRGHHRAYRQAEFEARQSKRGLWRSGLRESPERGRDDRNGRRRRAA